MEIERTPGVQDLGIHIPSQKTAGSGTESGPLRLRSGVYSGRPSSPWSPSVVSSLNVWRRMTGSPWVSFTSFWLPIEERWLYTTPSFYWSWSYKNHDFRRSETRLGPRLGGRRVQRTLPELPTCSFKSSWRHRRTGTGGLCVPLWGSSKYSKPETPASPRKIVVFTYKNHFG